MGMDIRMSNVIIILLVVLDAVHKSNAAYEFTCPPDRRVNFPKIPDAFSTDVRLNFPRQQKTVDMKYAIDLENSLKSIELMSENHRVKYIQKGSQLLIIKYEYDEASSCTVTGLHGSMDFLKEEDAGPSRLLGRFTDLLHRTELELSIVDATLNNGVFVQTWEQCYKTPLINISVSFSGSNWHEARGSYLHKGLFIASAEAQIGNDTMSALFFNFDPKLPDRTEFQPPVHVYCEGLISKKEIPAFSNFFSYDSEIISYKDSMGMAPVSFHRSVYYDYPSGMVRTDFYDAVAEDPDLFADVASKTATVIHDFKSGLQYRIDNLLGTCWLDDFTMTVGPATVDLTHDRKLPNVLEYFRLNASRITYNGEFPMRGYLTDVFTARVFENKERFIYTWYFATDITTIAEKSNVERDVLLRIDIHPETAEETDGLAIVNFYDFSKDEPEIFDFDITSCYNSNFSKTFIITFPAFDELRGMEKFIKRAVHYTTYRRTNLDTYRIFVTEVVFTQNHMFVDLKLLSAPQVLKQNVKNGVDGSLDKAVEKLNESIGNKTFTINIEIPKKLIVLNPLDDGVVEYETKDEKIKEHFMRILDDKERERQIEKERERERNRDKEQPILFSEGDVIEVAMGMVILGFILGAMLLNYIGSKKAGLTFFWKRKPLTRDPFSDAQNIDTIETGHM